MSEKQQVEEVQQKPVFEEIKDMSPASALDVILQAAGLAQSSGALSVRDSVILAKAIETLRPGSV